MGCSSFIKKSESTSAWAFASDVPTCTRLQSSRKLGSPDRSVRRGTPMFDRLAEMMLSAWRGLMSTAHTRTSISPV